MLQMTNENERGSGCVPTGASGSGGAASIERGRRQVDERLHRVERLRIAAHDRMPGARRERDVAGRRERPGERRRVRAERRGACGSTPPRGEREFAFAGRLPGIAGVEGAHRAAAQALGRLVAARGAGGVAQARGGLAVQLVSLARARLQRGPLARGGDARRRSAARATPRARARAETSRGSRASCARHGPASHSAAASHSA